MNMIRFNSQTIIEHLEYIDEIYYSEDTLAIEEKNVYQYDPYKQIDLCNLGGKEPGEKSNAKEMSLVKKGKQNKFLVWEFMEKVDKKTAKCMLCERLFSRKGGATANLLAHVLNNHKGTYELELLKQNMPNIAEQEKHSQDQQKFLSAKDMMLKLGNYKWQCKVCAKTVIFKSALIRHVLEHL